MIGWLGVWMGWTAPGCKPAAPPPAAAELAPAPAPVGDDAAGDDPDEVFAAVVRALSARDGEPDCATAFAGVDDPAAVLLAVVDRVSMPPTAPMRAAGCLVARHASDPAVAEAILGWVAGSDTRGLALLVGQHLDALPPDLAVAAATAASTGPWAAELAPAIAGSARPEVRAVLGATAPE